MPGEHHTLDQIVAKIRKADLDLGKGKKVPEVCKLLEVFVYKVIKDLLPVAAEVWPHEARDG